MIVNESLLQIIISDRLLHLILGCREHLQNDISILIGTPTERHDVSKRCSFAFIQFILSFIPNFQMVGRTLDDADPNIPMIHGTIAA